MKGRIENVKGEELRRREERGGKIRRKKQRYSGKLMPFYGICGTSSEMCRLCQINPRYIGETARCLVRVI